METKDSWTRLCVSEKAVVLWTDRGLTGPDVSGVRMFRVGSLEFLFLHLRGTSQLILLGLKSYFDLY